MNALPVLQFGIDWSEIAELSGSKEISLFQRHGYCAYHNIGRGAFYHRKERISALWPEYQWHRWNERRLRADCESNWLTWLGPASSGKSTDAAVFALEYWLQAPDKTAIIVCSTTMKMLRFRIWSEIAKYHKKLPAGMGAVGELLDSSTMIRWDRGNDRNGIFGMAVEDGPVQDAVNNLIGIKAERVVLYIDEMQGINEAIMKATFNLVANPVFKFRGMGNPDSLTNPLGKESEPVEGWDSVVRAETEEWETHGGPTERRGLCQFFDGRKSPTYDSLAEHKRLHWLTNKKWVDGILKGVHGNVNDPLYWQMAIGWPPPMGLESTLLDDAILVTYKCRKPAVWTGGFTLCAGLDAAFGGGDAAILQFIRRGEVAKESDGASPTDGMGKRRWVIEAREWMPVPINADSTRPIHYQILDFCRAQCEARAIPAREFALDSSGEGGGLKAIFDKEWGIVNGIEAGGMPSDLPIDESGKTAREAYDNRSSELCFSLRAFAMADGIRGLSDEVVKQACARRTFYRNGKWCVEPKTGSKGRTDEKGRPVRGFRQRMGYSPDNLDAFNIGLEHCRQMGAVPSSAGAAVQVHASEEEQPSEFNDDFYLLAQ